MLLIVYEGFSKNLKTAPSKIKIMCIFVFTGVALRYFTLIIFFGVKNIIHLYFLKPLYFLNLLCIPIGAIITIYILMRNNKIKFSYVFPISGVFILIYLFIIYKYPVEIRLDDLFGYYMKFVKTPYIYIGYMILNVIFMVVAINIYRKTLEKKGICFVIASAFIGILETMVYLIWGGVFISLILGDIFWILTLNYGLYKLKKPGR